jgi:hypothetical protein
MANKLAKVVTTEEFDDEDFMFGQRQQRRRVKKPFASAVFQPLIQIQD